MCPDSTMDKGESMNIDKLSSLFSRIFFLVAIVLLGLALLEKIVNLAGYTIVRVYDASRLLEFAATMMIFVIGIVLRQIREAALLRGGS